MHIWCSLDRLWSKLVGATSAFGYGGFLPVPLLGSLLDRYRWYWVESHGHPHPSLNSGFLRFMTYKAYKAKSYCDHHWVVSSRSPRPVNCHRFGDQLPNWKNNYMFVFFFSFSATQPSSSTVPKTEDQRPQLGGCHFVWIMPARDWVCRTWWRQLSPVNQKQIGTSDTEH